MMIKHQLDAASPGLHILGLTLRAMVLADDSNMADDADLFRPGQLPNDAVTFASDSSHNKLSPTHDVLWPPSNDARVGKRLPKLDSQFC